MENAEADISVTIFHIVKEIENMFSENTKDLSNLSRKKIKNITNFYKGDFCEL